MGIMVLMGLLLGAIAGVIYSGCDKTNKNPNKSMRWRVRLFAVIIGIVASAIFSVEVGEKIAKKYLASQAPVTVLETVNLSPFLNSNGVYIVTGENQCGIGRRVAWYLQDGELFEEPYNSDIIVFSNASAPEKQLVKADVGSFWKWFAVIPNTYRFVIPTCGLQEGRVVKTYGYVPVPEK